MSLACAEPTSMSYTGYLADGGDRFFTADDGRGYEVPQVYEWIGGATSPNIIPVSGNVYLDDVVTNSHSVYWSLTDGTVWQRGLSGGSPSVLSTSPGNGCCQGLAATDAWVLCDMVDYDDLAPSGIYRVPAAGGSMSFLVGVIQADLIGDGDHVYWADFNGGRLGRTHIESGSSETLVAVQANLLGKAGGYLYYEEYADIWRIPFSGGAPEQVSAQQYLGLSETHLYVRELTGILEIALDGSGQRILLEDWEAYGVAARSNSLSPSDPIYVMGEFSGLKLFVP